MPRPRVAFVASGGAAKGVAHVGVLRAMEELGIEADICVGASAGAIAGAFYSQGFTPSQMIDWFRPFWQRGARGPAAQGPLFSRPSKPGATRELRATSRAASSRSTGSSASSPSSSRPTTSATSTSISSSLRPTSTAGAGSSLAGVPGGRPDQQGGGRLVMRAGSLSAAPHRRPLLHGR